MVNFVPLGERVIIQPIELDQQTKGGIFLPDTAKEKPQEGKVVAVGPGRVADDGTRIPMELASGDRVISVANRTEQGVQHQSLPFPGIACRDSNRSGLFHLTMGHGAFRLQRTKPRNVQQRVAPR